MNLKQHCYVGIFVLVWLLIFIIPGGYYYQRNGGASTLKNAVDSLSLKVAEHKTTFDQAIKDITGKLNSAITSLNSKIKDLHENISDRQQNTRKALDQLQQSEESEGHIKGEIRQDDLCMDSMEKESNRIVELFTCHGEGRNQEWKFEKDGTVINRGYCLSVSEEVDVEFVILTQCLSQDGKQKWERTQKQIKNAESERCLDVHGDGKRLITFKCDASKKTQQWTFT